MSSVSDIPGPRPAEALRTSARRWRQRSRVILALRIVLPAMIVAIIAGLGASVALNALNSHRAAAGNPNDPTRLVNPHFVGRDTRGRSFLLTSVTATRNPQNDQIWYLDRPTLTMDTEGPDPTHVTAGSGVFHEDTGKLEVSHGVRMSGARGAVDTATSLFDTKTGELVGSDAVQGAGPLGEIQSKSYGVYDNGERMVFSGGAHARLQPK